MKVVYVAGPLSDNRSPCWLRLLRAVFGLPSGEEKNALVALRCATELRDRGFSVVVPHLCLWWERYYPAAYETWLGMDLALIAKVDAVFRVPGLSRGAFAETSHADRLGVPVFFSVDAITEWRDALERQSI